MSSTKAEGNTRVVNLDSFSLQQLSQIREQLEQEISQLTSGFTQLKQAQASFRDCKMSLDALKPENKDKPILVPLTESLYVPGTLDDIKSVLVDVGTGYYIEKEVPEARKFYDRKIDYLQKNTGDLQKVIEGKQTNLRTVIEVMRSKALESASMSGAQSK